MTHQKITTPSLLFWYLFKKYLLVFIASLFVLTSVIYLFDIIELLRSAIKRNTVSFGDVLLLGLLKSPQMIHIVLPFTTLISSIIFLFKMSKNSELIVMRAAGMSVWNFLKPLLVAGTFIGIAESVFFTPVISFTTDKYNYLADQFGMKSSNPLSFSDNGLWLKDITDAHILVLRADRISNKNNTAVLKNPSIFEYDLNENFVRQLESEQALLENGFLIMPDAFEINPTTEKGKDIGQVSFATNVSLKKIMEQFDNPETLSFWKFPKIMKFLKESGFSAHKHTVFYFQHWAFPLSLIAMILIASVFSLPTTTRQGGFLIRLILALFAGFMFYFLGRLTNIMGLSENLPIVLSVLGASLIAIFLCISALLYLEDG